METWVSGPGLEADHARATGDRIAAEEIAARAAGGDAAAQATLDRHASRLARGLAHVVNIFDPDVIVLGGGLSKLAHLYAVLPALAAPYVLAEPAHVVVKPPRWGDASGVRGAAWLWGTGVSATLSAGSAAGVRSLRLLLALARRMEGDLLELALDGELAVVDEQLAAHAVLEEQERQLVDRHRVAACRSPARSSAIATGHASSRSSGSTFFTRGSV